MAWTALTFAFGSLLTSTKIQQLQDNITAYANEDSGAPATSWMVSGTKMIFFQSAAPTGWTIDGTHNDKALRVVSSSGGGSGGSHSVSSPPTHTHTLATLGTNNADNLSERIINDSGGLWLGGSGGGTAYAGSSTSTGNGSTNFSPYYINVIVATKD